MTLIEIIVLGIGLAMDASAISMTNGMQEKRMKINKVLLIALFFGLFQGIMPLLGYFIANSILYNIILKFAPWIALILLSLLGGKMIYDALKKDDKKDEVKELNIKVLFLQAIATSIDALSVGLIFVSYGQSIAIKASIIIALITFILSFISVYIGKKFGSLLNDKAEMFGGVILVIIGIIIFLKGIL